MLRRFAISAAKGSIFCERKVDAQTRWRRPESVRLISSMSIQLLKALGRWSKRKVQNALIKSIGNAKWIFSGSFLSIGVRLSLDQADIKLARHTRIHSPGILTLQKNATMIMGSGSMLIGFFEIVIDLNGRLEIGDDVYIGAFANIRCNGKITIGDHTSIAQFVSIVGGNHGFKDRDKLFHEQVFSVQDVTIGRDAWLGANVVVLPGRTISDGAIVGAGSVVTRDVAPYEIVVGNPLRNIGWRK